jgi:hypothetical protein
VIERGVNANVGDFIKDLTPQERSLGMVMMVDKEVNMMYVRFPKTGGFHWILWENFGQYRVV